MATLIKDDQEFEVEFLDNLDGIHIVFTNGEKVSKIFSLFDTEELHSFMIDDVSYENIVVKTVALLTPVESDLWEGRRIAVVMTRGGE